MPHLIIDGSFAIMIASSDDITVKNLEISGPALDITGKEASNYREVETGRNNGGCGTESEYSCPKRSECRWSSVHKYCIGQSLSYYSG